MTKWALTDFFGYGLVFARVGGFIHLMPGISDAYVPPRVRLLLSLTLTIIITPVVYSALPSLPSSSLEVFYRLFLELMVGIAAGSMIKIMMSTLEIIGTLYGYQIGLANAFTFNPATSQQVGLPSAFLTSLMLTLIFSTGLYQHFLKTIVQSYEIFPSSTLHSLDFLTADLLQTSIQVFQASFSLSIQLGGPIIIFGFILMMAQGLLSRLVPQIQIYFVLQPLQIIIGFLILILTLAYLSQTFLATLEQFFFST